MSLEDRLRLKLKVKTNISLCMPIIIMLDHPWQSLYTQYYRTVIPPTVTIPMQLEIGEIHGITDNSEVLKCKSWNTEIPYTVYDPLVGTKLLL